MSRAASLAFAAIVCSTLTLARADQIRSAPQTQRIYSFQNGSDGAQPLASLIADKNGNLYGTSAGLGGSACPSACGSVFKLSPPTRPGAGWNFSILYDFTGGKDGGIPHGNVIFGPDGNLYGSNVRGGSPANAGIVYRLKPPATRNGQWTLHVVHIFGFGEDGDAPQGGLAFDAKGNLFGTTALGGRYGAGMLFELSPPLSHGQAWVETNLHNFGLGQDGNFPLTGLAVDRGGDLFGTTEYGGFFSSYCQSGCGTVFEVSPAHGGGWTYSILDRFDGGLDGANPRDPLIFDSSGNLYGTTLEGHGDPKGHYGGAAFELSPPVRQGQPWTETVLYSFPQYLYDAGYSSAALVFDAAGNLYGTSQSGGPHYEGTAFKLLPPASRGGSWTDAILHNFDKANGGATYPFNGLVFGAGGALYGTTPYGGSGNCVFGTIKGCGTVFQIKP